MFGWEFPPHISGGLGTACYGITRALSSYPDVDLTFVVPKKWGDEPVGKVKLIGAGDVDIIKNRIKTERFKTSAVGLSIKSEMVPYVDPEDYKQKFKKTDKSKDELKNRVKFSGKYTPDLMKEIHNFSIIAEHIAGKGQYDIIHAHDWLTFPAAVLAKKSTGKPLVIHVHATDFDRSGGKVNPEVYQIEKRGMEAADKIITVSNHTRQMVSEKYSINPSKIVAVHNGVDPYYWNGQKPVTKKNKWVTFLGRITVQKGPEYFIEVAKKVLSYCNNVEFIMAGSGDLFKSMVEIVSWHKISNKFHFPGFLKGDQVMHYLKLSDVFIMPSVSEPFGISPLEAMYCKVPVIISKQSGVSEVIQHAIKVDFWDTDAMADAVYGIISRPTLKKMLVKKGASEVRKITWENTASKIVNVYKQFIRA